MAQYRITNYGDGFNHEKLSLLLQNLFTPGPYNGYAFTVLATDRFSLGAGAALLPDGVLVLETAPVVFPPIVPMPAAATVFEVRLSHVDANLIGGQEATYSVAVAGTPVAPAPSVTTVLGYLRYPGGGVPIDASQWVPVAPQQPNAAITRALQVAPDVVVPPYVNCLDLGSPNITVADMLGGTSTYQHLRRLTGSALIPPVLGETRTFSLQWISRGVRPFRVSVNAQFPSNDTLVIEVRDANGNLVTATPASFTGTGAYATYSATVATSLAAFPLGRAFSVLLRCTLKPSTTFDLYDVTVEYDPLV